MSWPPGPNVPYPLPVPSSTASPINAFAISPDGQHIVGTYLEGVGNLGVSHWWRAELFGLINIASVPGWYLTPEEPLPSGWLAVSARGINDQGDIVGFYVADEVASDGTLPPRRPFVKIAGEPATPFEIPGLQMTGDSTLFDISNQVVLYNGIWIGRTVVGRVTTASGSYGFFASVDSAGIFIPGTFRPWGGDTVRGISNSVPTYTGEMITGHTLGSDLICTTGPEEESRAFVILDPGGTSTLTELADDPLLQNLSVVVSGINADRRIVGFYGDQVPKSRKHGFLGRVGRSGELLDLQTWDHPAAGNADTQLFGVADNGLIVGTWGKTHPFVVSLSSIPFGGIWPWPPNGSPFGGSPLPPPPARKGLDQLPTRRRKKRR